MSVGGAFSSINSANPAPVVRADADRARVAVRVRMHPLQAMPHHQVVSSRPLRQAAVQRTLVAVEGREDEHRRHAERENADQRDDDDTDVIVAGLVGSGGGGLTALVFAAREGDLESARLLIDGGANVNQTTEYGWTPLLTAVNNRHYKLATFLIERGADVNLANKGELDAALPGDGQPQYRGWRLSGSETGYGQPGVHQDSPRSRSRPESAGERQHAQPNHLYDAVVHRARVDAVHPCRAVKRCGVDEAAVRARGRSKTIDRSWRQRLDCCRGDRLGRGRDVRAISGRKPDSRSRCFWIWVWIRTPRIAMDGPRSWARP